MLYIRSRNSRRTLGADRVGFNGQGAEDLRGSTTMAGSGALIAGNWKMYGLRRDLAEIAAVRRGVAALNKPAQVALCVPATLAASAVEAGGVEIMIGGQDCHGAAEGAFTGDISATMLADAGARCVIVGHSERRRDHQERDALVRAKAEAAIAARLLPIVCVGETLAEREASQTEARVVEQLAGSMPRTGAFVIAYEPVWAIGSGLTPNAGEIAAVHGVIRRQAGEGARVLYGGSVKPGNAQEILAIPGVDGALVGGASLKADDFLAIVRAAPDRGKP
jgi:triosephosphate isomerase